METDTNSYWSEFVPFDDYPDFKHDHMTHDCTATVAPRKILGSRSDIILLDPLLVFQHEWVSTTTLFPFYYKVMLSMRNMLLQSTIRKATTQNANLVGHLRKSNRNCLFRDEVPKLPIYTYVLEENLLHAMC